MSLFEEANWIHVFLSGAITIIVSWLSSGCRLGDQIVNAPSPNPDRYSGYYMTQPQTLKFYATTTDTLEKEAATSLIPSEIGQFMTNPVAFLLFDPATGKAGLADPQGKSALPTLLKASDHSLSYNGVTSATTYWRDPACQSYLEISEDGSLSPSTSTPTSTPSTLPTENSLPIAGEIQITIRVTTQFQGNCTPTFLELSQCYQDPTQCGGSSDAENLQIQTVVMNAFAPWIQSQVMTATDIPILTNFAYEVFYQ